MKKLTLAFLSSIITIPAIANIHINPDTIVTVVQQHVPANKVIPVIREYNAQLKASNGHGIAANKLWNVCAAADWNIKKSTDKQKCQAFVKALLKSGKVVFKEICGDDKGKTGATERCVTDFKNVKVNIGPAIAIAKEYALVKYNDGSLQCSNKHRLSWNDDYIKCVSQHSNVFYEFQFDSVTNSIDNTIKNSIQIAICSIHDAPATTAGFAGGGTNVSGQLTYVDASCTADATKCANINKSLTKFGYVATYKNNTCQISFETVSDRKSLRTAFGIDNFVFCSGIQAHNNESTESYVKQYIASKAGVPTTSVKCDAGFHTYTGTGCKVNGLTDFKDDIKTCHVGNNVIDLVFDDINEKWTTYTNAADQAMGCIITGGTFSGKRCIGLGEQQCNTLRAANIKSCPECKKIEWDTKTKSCVLPAGASATNLQKGVNIGIIVGGTVAAVAVTIGTAGTGGAAVATVVLTGIETVGAGIEITSQLKIDGIADDFLVKSNQCKNSSCAETLLKQNLQRMSNSVGDMTNAEIRAVDTELARLNELIPTTSQFYTDIVVGESLTKTNAKSLMDSDSWEPEQVWRAVGAGLQLASAFTSVGKWILNKTGMLTQKLPKATSSITTKAQSSKAILREESHTIATTKRGIKNFTAIKTSDWRPQVFKFEYNGKTYYLKSTDDLQEIERTKQAYNIFQNDNIVSSVKLVSEDQTELANIAKENGFTGSDGFQWFLTEELTDNQETFFTIANTFENGDPSLFDNLLKSKPLTLNEQNELLDSINKLNQNGINHGDLGSNLFIQRDDSGKLHAYIIDYEAWAQDDPNRYDIDHMKSFLKQFQELGLAEKGPLKY